MESATARTTNHDNKLVYFGRKVIFLKLYNYSNKKGRLRMKENKNTCTRKKHEKLSNKKMKIIYITLLLALLVELIIIIAYSC